MQIAIVLGLQVFVMARVVDPLAPTGSMGVEVGSLLHRREVLVVPPSRGRPHVVVVSWLSSLTAAPRRLRCRG